MKALKLTFTFFLITVIGFGQTDTQIENLKTFSKAYGYVKYFHPSDEAANIDWDKFAIYGSDKIEKCKNKEEVLNTLNNLFHPIAPTVKFYHSEEKLNFDFSSVKPPDTKNYKTTYWQHLGVGIGMKNQGKSIYESVRVNRKSVLDISSTKSSRFGNLMTTINAAKYKGKTIKFTGSVKLIRGSEGTGHLWLRVDKPNQKMGFFNNMDATPITENVWKKYEIIGNVDSSAVNIGIGCFLLGDGELLTDDLKLFYKENENWIEIPIKNSDFESEELGLELKGKKSWVHRGDGYETNIIGEDSFEGKKCVSIKKINQTQILEGKKIFDAEPQPGEFINKDIGSGISCIVPLVLFCNDSHTFPSSDKNELDSVLKTVSVKPVDLSVRLGDLIITWNVFQHFFPYFDEANINWEKELEKALSKSFLDENENDFLITLQQFTAPLKDGHIRISGGSIRQFVPPIAWEFVEKKLVITKVCDETLKLKAGDIVSQVNGLSPEKYFEGFENRISAASPGWLAYRANTSSLSGDKDTKLSIVVNNETIDLYRATDAYARTCENSISSSGIKSKFIGNDIVYLNLDLIEMKSMDSLLPQLTKAKAIICDLRGYPNGNHEFISYLLTKKDTDMWMYVPQFLYPDREKIAGYKKEGWEMKPKKPHLNAKIVFITDGRAISYAESYMGFIEGYKLATIVGQPTAGTNGNINPFVLPGRYQISWTGMKVVKHDGSRLHGVGIIPDIYVSKTINGIKEGKDEFLEKAIELANKPD